MMLFLGIISGKKMTRELTEIEGFFETDNIYIALWKKASIQRDYTKIR